MGVLDAQGNLHGAAGSNRGGKFQPKVGAETGTALTAHPSPGERAAELAIDGAALGEEIGALVELEMDGITGCPTVTFTKPGAWTVVSTFPFADTRPYMLQTFTEDGAVTGQRRYVNLKTVDEVLTKVRADLENW